MTERETELICTMVCIVALCILIGWLAWVHKR